MRRPGAFDRQALLACRACGETFLNWTRTAPVCRRCGSPDLREIRRPPRGGHDAPGPP